MSRCIVTARYLPTITKTPTLANKLAFLRKKADVIRYRNTKTRLDFCELDEILSTIADLRYKMSGEDPLEAFCTITPDAEECRVYDV